MYSLTIMRECQGWRSDEQLLIRSRFLSEGGIDAASTRLRQKSCQDLSNLQRIARHDLPQPNRQRLQAEAPPVGQRYFRSATKSENEEGISMPLRALVHLPRPSSLRLPAIHQLYSSGPRPIELMERRVYARRTDGNVRSSATIGTLADASWLEGHGVRAGNAQRLTHL